MEDAFRQNTLDNSDEQTRYNSFKNRWNVEKYGDIKELARYGFYYTGREDIVKCQFCTVEVGQWERESSVYHEHRRWSPNCPLLKGESTDNVPTNLQDLTRYIETNASLGTNYTRKTSLYRGLVPDYSELVVRLNSFKDWKGHRTPKELSEAGFFYKGQNDEVTCFSCRGTLEDWKEEDVPWEQHMTWYSNCRFVGSMFTPKQIRETRLKFWWPEQGVGSPVEGWDFENMRISEGPKENSNGQCKVCMEEKLDVVLIPCMHVIVCFNCSEKLNTCPICRSKIAERKRIFFG
jgi:baculoviral IAP repeat-containing protein 7/8